MNIQKVSQALCCIVIGLLCTFLNDNTIGHSASIKLIIIGIIVIVLFILQYTTVQRKSLRHDLN